jgi:hypothetical protein
MNKLHRTMALSGLTLSLMGCAGVEGSINALHSFTKSYGALHYLGNGGDMKTAIAMTENLGQTNKDSITPLETLEFVNQVRADYSTMQNRAYVKTGSPFTRSFVEPHSPFNIKYKGQYKTVSGYISNNQTYRYSFYLKDDENSDYMIYVIGAPESIFNKISENQKITISISLGNLDAYDTIGTTVLELRTVSTNYLLVGTFSRMIDTNESDKT